MNSQKVGALLVALVALGNVNECLAQQRQTGMLGRVLGAAASVALAGAAANFVTRLANGRRGRRQRPVYTDPYAYGNAYGGDFYEVGQYERPGRYVAPLGGHGARGYVGGDVYSGFGTSQGIYSGLGSSGGVYGGQVYDQGFGGNDHGVVPHSHAHSGAVYPAVGSVGTRRRVTEYESTYNGPIVASTGLGNSRFARSDVYASPY